jgi:hypothetical protein
METPRRHDMETHETAWRHWPVAWSAIWVGALAALAIGLIIGLIGYAVGAHEVSRFVDWKKMRLTALVFSVGGAFFAFVVGGWAAARIAGIRRSESAMLHGAVVWLVAVPLLLGLAASGGATHFGGWYGGLAATPGVSTIGPSTDPQFAAAIRNNALAAVVALLLGLVGSVIGGWMASGEPMSLTYYRRRDREAHGNVPKPSAGPTRAAEGATPWR